MSKLDRQLDQASSNVPLKVVWHAFDDVDVQQLKTNIRLGVIQAERRCSLDCRDVDGAPDELVELLLELNEFAKRQQKTLTLSYASDELRAALRPGVHRRRPELHHPASSQGDAAMAAAMSLNARTQTPVQPAAKQLAIPLPTIPVVNLKKHKRWIQLIGTVLIGAAILVGIESYVIFNEEDTFHISELVVKPVKPDVKTFERGSEGMTTEDH